MNNEHIPLSSNNNNNTTTTPPLSSRFLIYSTACIICALVIFRHIKRQHRRTHSHAIPPERRKMRSSPDTSGGGEQREKSSHPVSVRTPNHSMEDPSLATTGPTSPASTIPPFPSACDILQPLSQLTSLPTSGHVAAAVARGLKLDWPFANTLLDQAPGAPGWSLVPGRDLRPDGSRSSPRPAAEDPFGGPGGYSGSDPARSLALACAGPALPVCGHSLSRPVSEAEEGWGGVQKRSETVQVLHDGDAQGPRSWRRLIVEYS